MEVMNIPTPSMSLCMCERESINTHTLVWFKEKPVRVQETLFYTSGYRVFSISEHWRKHLWINLPLCNYSHIFLLFSSLTLPDAPGLSYLFKRTFFSLRQVVRDWLTLKLSPPFSLEHGALGYLCTAYWFGGTTLGCKTKIKKLGINYFFQGSVWAHFT